MAGRIKWVPGSTKKICQLTGEMDRQFNRPTLNRTESRFGLRGTDLGASFEHNGRVCFLFGDTHPNGPNSEVRPFDGDSVAFSRAADGEGDVLLSFATAPDGKYRAMAAPGVSLKGFEVPTGGVSFSGQMYIFCTTDSRIVPGKGTVMGRSVLLRSRDDGATFTYCNTISRNKIVYIAPVPVTNPLWKGMPQEKGRGLLLYAASTEYRRSDPYLAYLPLAEIENPSALRFLAARDVKGAPQWSTKEEDAQSLFSHPCIGELSVSYNRFLRRWLMLYNCENRPGPRGIHFRVAESPWGPWSESELLFDPWRDKAYGAYMHIGDTSKPSDGLHDPGREKEWGGEYGPYVIDRFTKGVRGRSTTIYFVLSTWNPYNTVLMKSTLQAT